MSTLAAHPPATARAANTLRQRLLVLYLQNACLTSEVVVWAEYDGTGHSDFEGDDREPPYASVLAAMRDGWRVIKFPEIQASTTDNGYVSGPLPNEFVLEKLEDCVAPPLDAMAKTTLEKATQETRHA